MLKVLRRHGLRWMIVLSFVIYQLSFSPVMAQVGTWKAYMAYSEPQQIVKAQNTLFVRASNDLYQYNLNDKSITTYDKTNVLNDNNIRLIGWNTEAKRLIIIYDNSNIDFMDVNGEVNNLSALYNMMMTQDKGINSIYMDGIYAYLSTDFGVMKINMQRYEISETYMLNQNIQSVTISNGFIYACNNQNVVFAADMKNNLINQNNWQQTDDYPSFTTSTADWDNYIEIVKTLKPGGPYYNHFYESKIVNGKLYTTGGAFRSGQIALNNPGIIQEYDFDTWTVYPTNLNEITGISYEDINCIDIDPTDYNHFFAAGRCGLYEFSNGSFKTLYNQHNSPLKPVFDNSFLPDSYTLVHGIKFDSDGNLWVLNSQTKDVNLMVLKKNGEWETHTKSELFNSKGIGKPCMRCMMFDSSGLLWFVNTHFSGPSVHCYSTKTNEIISYSKFTNQDGMNYENCYPYDVQEDNQGNIWIATNQGPFYIKKEEKGQSNATLYQEKVPRNDGTNYADYLLSGIHTNGIAIDGGGRKWFATIGNGVFLVSADNMTQLQHFTAENSPLLSNNVQYISINHSSGEVFFLTEKGLCSYITDATTPSDDMQKDNVYAYPNPVESGYTGIITVVGLSYDADVKILTSSGRLVAQGRSNGGTFTWDGKDMQGKRVASGIYMVAATTSDGNNGIVCKLAIIR